MNNDYETKLAAFRSQQRKARFSNQLKTYLWQRAFLFIASLMPITSTENEKVCKTYGNERCVELEIRGENLSLNQIFQSERKNDDFKRQLKPTEDSSHSVNEADDIPYIHETFKWSRFLLYLLIWISMFSISIYVEFGVIFLILSGFYVIWTNTRTGPKRPNEISAYSVFNPNCESIDGTLDAKQLESEIRYGMMM